MALLTKKLNGSTLIESIVAMVALMVCLGIATMVYVNVITSGNSMQKFHAYTMIQQLSVQTKLQKRYLDEEKTEEGVSMKKTISKYGDMEKTFIMKIIAMDSNGKILSEQKEIINQ